MRPYGLEVLVRVGLGKELGKGWERDALKLEDGRGSWAGFFLGEAGSAAVNECVAMARKSGGET